MRVRECLLFQKPFKLSLKKIQIEIVWSLIYKYESGSFEECNLIWNFIM